MAETIKIRVQMEEDTANIKLMMNHPMETGQRKDVRTGQLIPAHFVQNVTATVNGKTVLDAQWGVAISAYPFLGFRVMGVRAGDKLAVTLADNKGEKSSVETTLG